MVHVTIRGTTQSGSWIYGKDLILNDDYSMNDLRKAAKEAGFINFATENMLKVVSVDPEENTKPKNALSRRYVEYQNKEAQKFYEKMGCQGYITRAYYDYYLKINDTYRFFTLSGKRYDVKENDIISMDF